MSKLINIDNGGTLTDICVIDGDRVVHTKTITTPFDLSKCFIEGLRKAATVIYGKGGEADPAHLDELLRDTDHIRYSTTQGTNALVQKKGPPLGLITDDLTQAAAFQSTAKEREMFEALVGVRFAQVRTALTGKEWTQAISDSINRLTAEGAQRIVVAFSGPDGQAQEERFIQEMLAVFPRHLLGAVPVLSSFRVGADPNLRRRAWTALNNAFLHPAMERFLYHAENLLRRHPMRSPLLIYRNDGYSGRVAKTTALRTYSSGPRGGMESVRALAAYYGLKRVVSFDVGGTTTDIGVVENGIIRSRPHGDIEGVECSPPLCDIVSVGIGGGSIIRVRQGQICVGPDSAGAMPGPVCFGFGGQEPTITDAVLLMGLIDPATYFGGGEMKLDAERARKVVQEKVADALGVSMPQAIHAMFVAWAKAIAGDLRRHAPIAADTVLLAFGGGGPLAALTIADCLGIETVLVPRLAAVFSAYGIGFSDIAHSAEACLTERTPNKLRELVAELSEQALRDMFSEGCEVADCRLSAWATIDGSHYAVDPRDPWLPTMPGDGDITIGVRAAKEIAHTGLPPNLPVAARPARTSGERTLGTEDGKTTVLQVIPVDDQVPGACGEGPAVLEESYWTCLVPPSWRFEFTANGDIAFRRVK